MSDISSTTIEEFRDARLEQGVKPASVALELRHLRAVFNKAFEWEMEDWNPMSGVRFPKQDIVKERYLTSVEIDALEAAIDEAGDREFSRLVIAYLHTGARRIELLAPNLKWDDVDFDKRQILINGKGRKRRYAAMPMRW